MKQKSFQVKSKKFLVIFMFVLALVLVLGFETFVAKGAVNDCALNFTESFNNFEDVASFNSGAGETEIGVQTGEEIAPWGPSSFTISNDGSFYVIDGVNSKILVATSNGTFKNSISLETPIVCPVDIQVIDNRIFVLDLPGIPPKVYEVNMDGSILRFWEIPHDYLQEDVSGFRVELSKSGEVFVDLEIANSWEVPFVKNNKTVQTVKLPKIKKESRVELDDNKASQFALKTSRSNYKFFAKKDWNTWKTGSIIIFNENKACSQITFKTKELLGSLKFIDCDESGNVYVYTEEISDSLDSGCYAFIKKFNSKGTFKCSFEIPVRDFFTFPNRAIRIDKNGDIYLMIPKRDKVVIKKVVCESVSLQDLSNKDSFKLGVFLGNIWQSTIARIGDFKESSFGLARAVDKVFKPQIANAAWTPLNANDRAWSYKNNSWYCNSANYYRSCGDYKPRYITSYNRYWYSVPYCWGGFDLPSTFNSAMGYNRDAGDINTTGSKRWCTAGVDCSGFVSRLWGLGTKYSTWGLTGISYPISKSSMKFGDVFNWPGHHVIFFRYYVTGGTAVFESTTANSWDRVVNTTRTWSAVYSYGAYRYQNW